MKIHLWTIKNHIWSVLFFLEISDSFKSMLGWIKLFPIIGFFGCDIHQCPNIGITPSSSLSLSLCISPLFFSSPLMQPNPGWRQTCAACVRVRVFVCKEYLFAFSASVHYFSFLSLSVIGWTETSQWVLKTQSQGLNLVFNAWLQRCHLSCDCSRRPQNFISNNILMD